MALWTGGLDGLPIGWGAGVAWATEGGWGGLLLTILVLTIGLSFPLPSDLAWPVAW